MNRSQRRKQAKMYNTPAKFNAMVSNERHFMQQEMEKRKSYYIEVILTMVAYTIQYKLGLGKKRLPEIMGYIMDNIDAFNTGHLNHEDFKYIKKELKEKYDVEF